MYTAQNSYVSAKNIGYNKSIYTILCQGNTKKKQITKSK